MSRKTSFISKTILTVLILSGLFAFRKIPVADSRMVSFRAQPAYVQFFWKDDNGHILGSLERLRSHVQQRKGKLVFAMNGGMYLEDQSPQGLYIENYKLLKPADYTTKTFGNFYMMPNGIFYITRNNKAVICKTTAYRPSPDIRCATQLGPMLVIDGAIHPQFKKGSRNLNIRNGVGILPDQSLVFAMSKEEISFYDFADYFKRLGCRQALYLDGFVSRTYSPQQRWMQLDGNFGVMIGVVMP